MSIEKIYCKTKISFHKIAITFTHFVPYRMRVGLSFSSRTYFNADHFLPELFSQHYSFLVRLFPHISSAQISSQGHFYSNTFYPEISSPNILKIKNFQKVSQDAEDSLSVVTFLHFLLVIIL